MLLNELKFNKTYLRNADKILVMKEGSIEEEGTHNELMGMDFFVQKN